MPFFNRSNNEDLILAIQSAGVGRERNDFRKDKSGDNFKSLITFIDNTVRSKLAVSEEDLLEHTTDGTDALSQKELMSKVFNDFQFDTLYIGCPKFPFPDTFVVNISGVI